ncbi:GntR family transcriptional regulator [Glaciibacter flavus]|uniref:GntR family transcriptional regulator n=1 Tax=Orlajensenia flava TaxID=2565934 RepID=UPI003B0050C8
MTDVGGNGQFEELTSSATIYEYYRGSIATGRLGSGERLPTVRQVAADLGVAVGTAARAYRQLEREGLVVTRTGAGTRVAPAASPLPGAIVNAIRELITATIRERIPVEEVLAAIRVEAAARR